MNGIESLWNCIGKADWEFCSIEFIRVLGQPERFLSMLRLKHTGPLGAPGPLHVDVFGCG